MKIIYESIVIMKLYSLDSAIAVGIVFAVVIALWMFGSSSTMLMTVSIAVSCVLAVYLLVLMGQGKVEGFIASAEYTDLQKKKNKKYQNLQFGA